MYSGQVGGKGEFSCFERRQDRRNERFEGRPSFTRGVVKPKRDKQLFEVGGYQPKIQPQKNANRSRNETKYISVTV